MDIIINYSKNLNKRQIEIIHLNIKRLSLIKILKYIIIYNLHQLLLSFILYSNLLISQMSRRINNYSQNLITTSLQNQPSSIQIESQDSYFWRYSQNQRFSHQANLRIQRAKSQRMYLLNVTKRRKIWYFKVLGNSGLQYQLSFFQLVECSCPDYRDKKNICKHIYFIIIQVAQLQQDFLEEISDCVLSIYAYEILNDSLTKRLKKRITQNVNKKIVNPIIDSEQDCSICYNSMKNEEIIKCESCKKYLHEQCMIRWLSKKKSCPLCRGIFKIQIKQQFDPLKKLKKIKLN